MATVFDKKAVATENLKIEYQAEKEARTTKIWQMTIDVDWLAYYQTIDIAVSVDEIAIKKPDKVQYKQPEYSVRRIRNT